MHEEFDELAALEAIGGATDAELTRLEEHCGSCAPCRGAMADYRDTAGGFAIALAPVTPRRDARDILLMQVESEAVADSIVAEATEDAAIAKRRTVPAWWFAAAAIFFLALFAWSELRLRALREELQMLEAEKMELSDDTLRLTHEADAARSRLETMASANQLFRLSAAADATKASANVYMDGDRRRALVIFANLEQNDPGHSYQLWIIRGDKQPPMSAGVFDADGQGHAELQVTDLPADVPIAGLAVTLEPHGGQSAPSGTILLQGKA